MCIRWGEPSDAIQLSYNKYSALDLNYYEKRDIYFNSAILEHEVSFRIISKVKDEKYNDDFDLLYFALHLIIHQKHFTVDY